MDDFVLYIERLIGSRYLFKKSSWVGGFDELDVIFVDSKHPKKERFSKRVQQPPTKVENIPVSKKSVKGKGKVRGQIFHQKPHKVQLM